MELFLWLWLYDKRYLGGCRLNLKIYQFLWLFPILINLITGGYSLYFLLNNIIVNKINYFSNVIFFSKIILCLLSVILSIILLILIIKNIKKEYKFYQYLNEEINGEIPNEQIDEYWIGRNSLCNIPGYILLFISFVQVGFSFYYIFNSKYNININDNYINFLFKYHSLLEVIFFIPPMLILFLAIIIKVFCFACAYICPGLLSGLSKCNSEIKEYEKLDFSDIESPISNV